MGKYCSDTNHQGRKVCITLDSWRYCGYLTAAGPADTPDATSGYRPEGWRTGVQLWDHSDPARSVAFTQLYALAGKPLVMFIEVPDSFDNPDPDGYVEYVDATEDSRGQHAVLLTGMITNDRLQGVLANAPSGSGGGYFIVKNSWGTCWGDAGYVYLPFDWVRDYTVAMTAVQLSP